MEKKNTQRIQIKPLSVNDAWQGKRYKTLEYKSYEEELMWRLPRLDIPKNERLALSIYIGFSNVCSDTSNILKPFEDILCKKYGLNDK